MGQEELGPVERDATGSGQGSRPRRRSRWRHVRRALLLGLVALILLVAVAPLRNGVLGPLLVRVASRVLADEAHLEVDGLSGSWWSSLELRGVELVPRESSALPEVRAGRVRVEYSLPGLVGGDLAALHAVVLEDTRVSLSLGPAAPEEETEEGASFEWPSALPRVDARGLDFRLYTAAGDALHVAGSLAASPVEGAGAHDVRVRLSDVTWDGAAAEPVGGAVELDARYRPDVLDVARLQVAGEELVADATLRPVDGGLGIEATVAPYAGGLRVDGALGADGIRAELESAGLDLRRLARPPAVAEALRAWGVPPIEGRIELRASGTLDPAQPADAEVRAELRVAGPRVGPRAWDAVELEAALSERVLTAERLVVRLGADRVAAREIALPLAEAFSPELLSAASAVVEIQASDVPRWLELDTERVPTHRLSLEARLAPGAGARVAGSLEIVDGGSVELRETELHFPRDLARFEEEARLETELVLDVPDLGRFGALFGRAGWDGRLAGVLELEGAFLRPTGTLLVDGRGVAVEGLPLGTIDVLAGVDPERIEVAALDSTSEAGRLLASGRYLFATASLEDVRFELEVEDPTRYGLPEVGGGALSAQGELAGPVSAPTGALSVSGTGLAVGAGVVLDRLEARAALEPEVLRLRELRAVAGETELTTAAVVRLDDGRAEVTGLALRRAGGDLALEEPFGVEWGGGRVDVTPVVLAGADERVVLSGSLEGSSATPVWEATAELRLGPSLALLRALLPEGSSLGAVDLRAAARGDADGIVGNVEGDVRGYVPGRGLPPGGGSVAAALESDALRVEDLRFAFEDGASVELAGSVAWNPLSGTLPRAGAVDVTGRFAVPDLGFLGRAYGRDELRDGAVRGEVELGGDLSALEARAELALESAYLLVPGGGADTLVGPLTGDARATWTDELAFELGLEAPRQARLDASGSVGADGDVGRLFETGLPADAALEAEAEFALGDPAPLIAWVEAVRTVGGRFEGGVSVAGTVGAPEVEGWLGWQEGSLKLASTVPAFDGVSARLRVRPDEIVVEELAGEMGGAPFTMGGTLALGDGAPAADLALRGEDLLLYRGSGVKVRADADLALTGPLDGLTVGGKVVLRDSRFVKNVDFLRFRGGSSTPAVGSRGFSLFSFREPPLSSVRFDVRVTAAQPFRVENNVIDGGVRPDLHLGGTGFVPELSGPIYLEPTTVSLPATRLRMTAGTIFFDRETWLGPRVELRGEARTRGYDVTITISGPYDEPRVTLSSIPPLPQDDLIVLLLTGQTPETADTASGAENVAMFLALDAGARWFSSESTEADESLLERVDVYTGGDVTESGAETVEVSFRLTGDEYDPRLLFLTGERDVYDRINFGLRILFRLP